MEKSLSPHYLLTIHYWTRYTRFRIPIAKSFPRRICIPLLLSLSPSPLTVYRLPYSTANKQTARTTATDTDLHSRSPIRIRALIRILEINRSPKGTARVRSSRVCLENKNASSKLVYPTSRCRSLSLSLSLFSSLFPSSLNPRPSTQRVFFFPKLSLSLSLHLMRFFSFLVIFSTIFYR